MRKLALLMGGFVDMGAKRNMGAILCKVFHSEKRFFRKNLTLFFTYFFLVQVHRRDVAVLYGVTHSLAESTRLCGGYNRSNR